MNVPTEIEGKERRRFLRVPFEAKVTIKNLEQGAVLEDLETKNISMRGIYCYTKRPFPVDTLCAIELLLTGTSSELWLRIEGKVIRVDQEGMALIFDSMDLDAFIHLKNILYYNSGDPDRINRELLQQSIYSKQDSEDNLSSD